MDNPPFELYKLDRDLSHAQVIEALAATPGRLRQVLAGATPDALTRRPEPGEWSALETVRHFRDVVQVYGMRFKWMVLQPEPLLANYDENAWVEDNPDGVAELPSVLDEIAAYRAETVRLLRTLNDAGWQRTGRHEVLGIVVLDPYVRHELAHEEQHLAQLAAALG